VRSPASDSPDEFRCALARARPPQQITDCGRLAVSERLAAGSASSLRDGVAVLAAARAPRLRHFAGRSLRSDSTLYAAVLDGDTPKVFASGDGGATWTPRN